MKISTRFPRRRAALQATATRLLLAILLLLAAGAAALEAQAGRWGSWRRPIREGLPDRQEGFTFCRLLYTSVRSEAMGTGWNTDYPMSDGNFMMRLSQFTATRVTRWDDGEPGHAVLRATDPDLFRCPFLFASDVGTAGFDGEEVVRLREYLLKGGFLWVDDFWGDRAWAHWVRQILQVLPGSEIVELSPDHPMFSAYYQVRQIPQVPSIQYWRRSGGRTSERGSESAIPRMLGIFDGHGRMLVLMSHNTDIADGWEREGEDDRFLAAFSPDSYAVGINAALWAMTH